MKAPKHPKRIAGLEARWVPLPRGAPRSDFGCFVPADPDAVLEAITEETVGPAERLPYFVSLWPAGLSLTRHLLEGPALRPRRVLDLGCGLGASGLAAARRGASVWFQDWEPRALAFVRASAEVLSIEPAGLVAADWAAQVPGAPFELVLLADLLYEARNLPALLSALPGLLAEGGQAWIADPGREGFEQLLASPAPLSLHALLDLPRDGHEADVRLAVLRR